MEWDTQEKESHLTNCSPKYIDERRGGIEILGKSGCHGLSSTKRTPYQAIEEQMPYTM